MEHVSDDAVIVEDALRDWIKGFAGTEIEADNVPVGVLFLERDDGVLSVEAGVCGERLWDDEESVGESLDAHLGFALDLPQLEVAGEVCGAGNLECAGAGDEGAVLDGILDGAETVADGVLNLRDCVCVGPLDEEGDGARVLDLLDKGELVLAERLLIDEAGPAEHVERQVLDAVLCDAAADELQAFHVASLGAAERDNVVFCEDVEGKRVDALLVDDDKALLRVVSADGLLQVDNLFEFCVDKSTLR